MVHNRLKKENSIDKRIDIKHSTEQDSPPYRNEPCGHDPEVPPMAMGFSKLPAMQNYGCMVDFADFSLILTVVDASALLPARPGLTLWG